jgi:transcriptional regulator
MPMYLPPHFEQTKQEAVADLIASFPLATIVTTGTEGIAANHIPMQLSAGEGEFGTLRGHVARNNAVWHDTDVTAEALAIFHAPDAYISPNWYATKQETHEVVPTWNYAVVHAYGQIRFHDDEKWLRGVIGKLTKSMEADQPKPWNMGQAPRAYTAAQLNEIVGVEIVITRLIAKWKVSQNRTLADRQRAAAGLREAGKPVGQWIADAIDEHAPPV